MHSVVISWCQVLQFVWSAVISNSRLVTNCAARGDGAAVQTQGVQAQSSGAEGRLPAAAEVICKYPGATALLGLWQGKSSNSCPKEGWGQAAAVS